MGIMAKNTYLEELKKEIPYNGAEINLSKLDTSFYDMVQKAKNIGKVNGSHGKCEILANKNDTQTFSFKECHFGNTTNNKDLEPKEPDSSLGKHMKCSTECVKVNKNSIFGHIFNMPIGWTEDGKKTIKEVKANMLTSVSEDGEIL